MRIFALAIAFVMAFAVPAFAQQQGFAQNVQLTDGSKPVTNNPIIHEDG